MRWEKVALDLAVDAGIAAPNSTLFEIAERSVLVVNRFDRTAAGGRIGYLSAMTMLEASDGDERSYLELAEQIETTSNRVTDDLHQLWRRIVFSILISNTDDHLRNHGFLHHGAGTWRLAPAFDLNPNPAPGVKYLATAIDATDNEARLDTALAVASEFRVSANAARIAVHEIRAAVNGWQQKAASHGLSNAEIAAMAPAFAEHAF